MSSYDDLSRRWTPRPTATTSLRLMALVAPFALGAAAAVVTSRLVGPPDAAALAALRVAAIATIATATVLITDLGARRLRVLASLLHLGLAFPGPAPSRIRLALTGPSRRRIPVRMADLVESGLDPDPERAARQVVELLGGFGEHDHRTRGHAERARLLCELVAEEMDVGDDDRARLQWAALLHDIGNSSIPAEVLDKQGKLSPTEWRALRSHPETGDRMIRPLKRWLGDSADVVAAHHERWDGGGYPRGLGAGKVSRYAGIVAVTDAFEAMTAPRRYRAPLGIDEARAEIESCAGTQFDPRRRGGLPARPDPRPTRGHRLARRPGPHPADQRPHRHDRERSAHPSRGRRRRPDRAGDRRWRRGPRRRRARPARVRRPRGAPRRASISRRAPRPHHRPASGHRRLPPPRPPRRLPPRRPHPSSRRRLPHRPLTAGVSRRRRPPARDPHPFPPRPPHRPSPPRHHPRARRRPPPPRRPPRPRRRW